MYNKINMVDRYYKIFRDDRSRECVLVSKDVSEDCTVFVDNIYFDSIVKAIGYIYLSNGFEVRAPFLPKYIEPFFDWVRLEDVG